MPVPPRLRRLAVALAVAAVAFVRVWPPDGATTVVGRPEGELRDHLWLSWGFAHTLLVEHRLPLHVDFAAFPAGLGVYPLDPLHQAAIIGLTPVLGTVGAVNTVAFLLFAALVYGGQKLAAAANAGLAAELACGALAALSPAFLGAFADTQTEGMASGWLLLLLAELFADHPRPRRAALWGGLLLASGPYIAHGVAVVCVITWFARQLPWRAALPVVLVAGVLGAAMVSTETGAGGALAARAAHVGTATEPPRSTPLGVKPPPPLPDEGVVRHVAAYPGAAETGPRRFAPWLLGALVLLAIRDRRARAPAALAAAYAAIALGNRFGVDDRPVDFPTPYSLFWRFYPLAKYAWKPAQYAVPATAFALLAVAKGWPRAPRALAGATAALALGAAIELLVRSPTPLPLPASTLHPRTVWTAMASSAGGVVEFPCRDRSVPGHPPVADVLLGPLWHGRPLGETPNREPSKVHAALLGSLEGAITGHPPKGSRPLGEAVRDAARAGFTDLLLLTEPLGADATGRLTTALTAAGLATPPPVDGVLRYSLADASGQ